MDYKAFISYKHNEFGRQHAVALEKALKQYAKPLLQRPIRIFRDEKHMVPNLDLSSVIKKGLDQSEYFIFLAEKGAAASQWCQQELEYWCKDLGRKDRLIIIHIGDHIALDVENNQIDWEKTDALPGMLRQFTSAIPFYIDLCWAVEEANRDLGNISYKSAINSIAARFRNISPEELNDSEIMVYRRNKRLRDWAIITLSVLLLLSIITTWWALDRTKYAKGRQSFAEAQQRIAQDSAASAIEQRRFAILQQRIAQDSAAAAQRQREIAQLQSLVAEAQRDTAFSRLLEARAALSRLLANRSSQKLKDNYLGDALAYALESLPNGRADWPVLQEAEAAVYQAVLKYKSAFVRPVLSYIGHDRSIQGTVFSDAEGLFASWSFDRTVRIWDQKSGRQVGLIEHEAGINGALFSPSKDRLLSWSFDGTAKIFNLKNKKVTHLFRHEKPVRGAQFLANGKQILTWSEDGNARIWDIKSMKVELEAKCGLPVRTMHLVDEDTKFLASNELMTYFWDIEKKENIAEFIGGNAQVNDASTFSLTIRKDSIFVWDLATAKMTCKLIHDRKVLGAQFLNDGAQIISWSRDQTVRIWDINTCRNTTFLPYEYSVRRIVISPDERYVLALLSNGPSPVWDLANRKILFFVEHADLISGAVFNNKGDQLMTSSYDGQVKIWDREGKLISTLQHDTPLSKIMWSENDYYVWTLSKKGTMRIWAANSGIEVAVRSNDSELIGWRFKDGAVITWALDGTCRLWKIDKSIESPASFSFNTDLNSIKLLDDSKSLFVTLSSNGKKYWSVWDTYTSKRIYSAPSNTEGTQLSNDQQTLLFYTDEQVCLWNLPDSSLITCLHYPNLSNALFSADDSRVILRTKQGQIHLLTLKPDMQISSIDQQTDIKQVAFIDQNRCLLSHSQDSVIKIIDLTDGKVLFSKTYQSEVNVTIPEHKKNVYCWTEKGLVDLLQFKDRVTVQSFQTEKGILALDYSRVSDHVIIRLNDATVWALDVSKKKKKLLYNANGDVGYMKISADGKYLEVSDDQDPKKVSIINLEKGKIVGHLSHFTSILGSTFIKNERIVTWSSDGSAKIWDRRNGNLHTFLYHGSALSGIQISNNDSYLLSWSEDGILKIWELATGNLLATLNGQAYIRGAAFSKNDDILYCWDKNGTITAWPFWSDKEDIYRIAQEVVEKVQPLSLKDRCQASLETIGCQAAEADFITDMLTARGIVNDISQLVSGTGDKRATVNMEISLLRDGGLLLVLERSIPDLIQFIEYNRFDRTLTLVSYNGKIGSLFYTLPAYMARHMDDNSTIVVFVLFDDHEPVGYEVPLVIY